MKSILILIIFFPTLAFAQQSSHWPTTVDEAVNILVANLDEKGKITITQTIEENLVMYNTFWGGGIRNDFGLWRGNKELLASCGSTDIHPDSASMVIIKSVWKKLREDLAPEKKLEYEKIENAIRKVSVPSCDSECHTVENAIVHVNNAIKSTDTGLSGFEIILDTSIDSSKPIKLLLRKTTKLNFVVGMIEFRAWGVASYDYPKIVIKPGRTLN